jgi:hypothetical protein
LDSAEGSFQLLQAQLSIMGQRRSLRLEDMPMSQAGEPDFYLVDVETFTALRRIVRRLADDTLVGEDRRNLAIRMNALLQRAQQPEHRASGRPTIDSDHWASSSLLKESFWKHRAHA